MVSAGYFPAKSVLHTLTYVLLDNTSTGIILRETNCTCREYLNGTVAHTYYQMVFLHIQTVRICNNVLDFNERNIYVTEKFLHQGFRYYKLVKTFAIFFNRYKELILKYARPCKGFIRAVISYPLFYGNIL